MIKELEVKNFKSLKNLKLECKRVNLFIGKPNTGKSNILESLGIFSFPYGDLSDFVRFENMINLFYDANLEEKIGIANDIYNFEMKFENGRFRGNCVDKIPGKPSFFHFDYDYGGKGGGGWGPATSPFRFYRFAIMREFKRPEANFLLPPRGDNLLSILQTNKALRKVVADIFSEYGLRIVLKPQEYKIEVQKEVEDVIISYPYSLVSDTLQRIVFHLVAIETNKDSIIIFEEPEAHAFPFFTKFIGEKMALDKTNQYFISTHNPYFLLSVIEKAPEDDIGIFITYFEDYQTKVKPLAKRKLPQILDLDANVFFNLDQFLEE
ncbi:MAG: AAA family ATPase [Syntrophaceae bacterium]|nr:AAA family ATPase [Syntrophaceae bacterium]